QGPAAMLRASFPAGRTQAAVCGRRTPSTVGTRVEERASSTSKGASVIANVTRWILVVALLAPAFAASARSSVTGLQGELIESEEEGDHRDWRLVGTLGLTTGMGSFVSNQYADNPYWANYALLQPSYTFTSLP